MVFVNSKVTRISTGASGCAGILYTLIQVSNTEIAMVLI